MRFRDHSSRQHGAILSNGNISVYIFAVLFTAWLGFQVWARYGGGTPPAGLDPMVMAALGVAVAGKSVERGAQDRALESEVSRLKAVAAHEHPQSSQRLDRLEEHEETGDYSGRIDRLEEHQYPDVGDQERIANPDAAGRLDRLEETGRENQRREDKRKRERDA